MASTAAELRVLLLQTLLTAAESEYEENDTIARTLEDKAQKTTGIAGFLLAAALAFVKPETFHPIAERFSKVFAQSIVGLAIVLLLISVGFSLGVLWPRKRSGQPPVPRLKVLVDDLLALPEGELSSATQERFFHDRYRQWVMTIGSQELLQATKASMLLTSHIALGASLVMTGWLIFLSVLAS